MNRNFSVRRRSSARVWVPRGQSARIHLTGPTSSPCALSHLGRNFEVSVMPSREKRRSERKSVHDCRTEFKITRNVSDPEIEIKQSSGDQVSEISEQEKLYKAKKALIDDKLDQWIKFQCERENINFPSEIHSCFDPTPYKNSINLAKSAIENRIYHQKAGDAIRATRELQAKILLDAANIIYEEPCSVGYNFN